ncbi:PucR family transcriptional regulator [Streptomyces iconiensis]|uniref:Helix-turn-helix domain-containing protein n=1 Tax=Streptomyces iconiensis TaxID=1384038 RepID=A0ABT6ZUT6_9ACTN|nr:PucR family transcriptional regulator [Streptomyces iconiensis]MDJ1132401.1 helix-turn-helix domain-containing protein [Streptomyces iconiensis]
MPGHGVVSEGEEVPVHEGVAGGPVPDTVERARRLLFATLTAEPWPPGAYGHNPVLPVPELARSARWPLPATVCAVVLATPCETPPLATAFAHTLAGPVDGEPCFLLPDPDAGTCEELDAVLRGWTAAVGHTVSLADTTASVRWARRLLELAPVRGAGAAEQRAAFVDDHLSMLLLLQDESLARALSERWLGPLAELTPRQSERLEVTLLAWLESGGAPEAAKVLQVHPQTVRYRLRQIEKVFGPALRDPRSRFELELALRSRRLLDLARRNGTRATSRRPRPPASLGTRLPGAAKEARINGL